MLISLAQHVGKHCVVSKQPHAAPGYRVIVITGQYSPPDARVEREPKTEISYKHTRRTWSDYITEHNIMSTVRPYKKSNIKHACTVSQSLQVMALEPIPSQCICNGFIIAAFASYSMCFNMAGYLLNVLAEQKKRRDK